MKDACAADGMPHGIDRSQTSGKSKSALDGRGIPPRIDKVNEGGEDRLDKDGIPKKLGKGRKWGAWAK